METGQLAKERVQIHNTSATRELMYQIMDPQMANIADYDCFSQVVFRSFEDYKKIKDDPWYKEHLVGDHENFADTKRSKCVTVPYFSKVDLDKCLLI